MDFMTVTRRSIFPVMGCARAKILLALVLLAFYRVPFCCAGSKRNSAGAGDDWHYADSKTLIDRESGDGSDDDVGMSHLGALTPSL